MSCQRDLENAMRDVADLAGRSLRRVGGTKEKGRWQYAQRPKPGSKFLRNERPSSPGCPYSLHTRSALRSGKAHSSREISANRCRIDTPP
jgi:hypothetical protein